MSVKLKTFSLKDKKASDKQYDFNLEEDVNIGLLHQVTKGNRTNARNNTASVKTRSQVSGTGAKPWVQKGTGRARHGSLRSPIFVGGGIAHGPGGRVYKDRTPKKMKQKSLNMSLSNRILENSVFVIDGSGIEKPSTKVASEALKELSISKSFVFIYAEDDDFLIKSFRNLKKAKVTSVKKLSTFDVISNDENLSNSRREIVDDKHNGEIKYIKHGKGILAKRNSFYYKGDFRNDVRYGKGLIIYKNTSFKD